MQQLKEKMHDLRQLVGTRSNYAKTVQDRLLARGITVSRQQVYATVSGRVINDDIVTEFASYAEEVKKRRDELDARLANILK